MPHDLPSTGRGYPGQPGHLGQPRADVGLGTQTDARRQAGPLPDPRQDDVARFRAALSQPAPGEARPALPAGPFDLLSRGLAQAPAAREQMHEQLRDQMREMVTRLMVSDDGAATRAVRLTLDDALLPGVDLAVYEEEGAWVAHFHCRAEAAFIDLAAAAADLAARTAEALGRPAVWRVEAEGLAEGGAWCQTPNLCRDGVTAESRAMPLASAPARGGPV